MSRTRVYTDDTIAIISRFFAAIDALIAMKKLKAKGTYCRLYGIDKSNFYAQKRDYNKGVVRERTTNTTRKKVQRATLHDWQCYQRCKANDWRSA